MSSHETRIELDERVPLVRIIREFDAPPAKVYLAWTDPRLVAQWLGPRDRTMEIETYDCVTGGAYRYGMRNGDDVQWFHGCFHQARPADRLVQTFTWEGRPDQVALETLTLVDLGDGRTRVESTSLVDSFEDRDAFVRSGMEKGVTEGYEKLDALLAR